MLEEKNKEKVLKLKTSKDILIKNDFISFLIDNPKKVSKDTVFLTRDEANER